MVHKTERYDWDFRLKCRDLRDCYKILVHNSMLNRRCRGVESIVFDSRQPHQCCHLDHA
jgi:hypothetical protein